MMTSRCGSPLLLLTCALLMTSSHSEGHDHDLLIANHEHDDGGLVIKVGSDAYKAAIVDLCWTSPDAQKPTVCVFYVGVSRVECALCMCGVCVCVRVLEREMWSVC